MRFIELWYFYRIYCPENGSQINPEMSEGLPREIESKANLRMQDFIGVYPMKWS